MEQICSASSKFSNEIRMTPSEPKNIPSTIKIKSIGTPMRFDIRFPTKHARITIDTKRIANVIVLPFFVVFFGYFLIAHRIFVERARPFCAHSFAEGRITSFA